MRSASTGEELDGVEDAVDFIAELRQTSDLATLPIGRASSSSAAA
jgi:hypothetical protein